MALPLPPAAVAAVTDSAWLGLLAAILISVALSLVHGYASITQRGNQIVSGVAINFIVAGSTVILGEAWFRPGRPHAGSSAADARFQPITFPCADAIRDVPIIGPIYSNLLSGTFHPDLCRLSRGAAQLVDPLPHPLRPAPSRRRRKSRARSTQPVSR